MRYTFSKLERAEIVQKFEIGKLGLVEIAETFGCSHRPIVRILVSELGEKRYKEIAKEHIRNAAPDYTKFQKGHSVSEKNKVAVRLNNQLHPNSKGYVWTEEQREGLREQRKGRFAREKHWNWKGGISGETFEKTHNLTKVEWARLAQEIRKCDYFICQYCGKKRSSSVHHIIPRRVKIDNHPDNLITLCRSCHVKVEKLTEIYLKEDKDPIEIFYKKWSK